MSLASLFLLYKHYCRWLDVLSTLPVSQLLNEVFPATTFQCTREKILTHIAKHEGGHSEWVGTHDTPAFEQIIQQYVAGGPLAMVWCTASTICKWL